MFIIINSIAALILFIFAYNGINHFIENVSSEKDKFRDAIVLKSISVILLLTLLGSNVIMYYNTPKGTDANVVDEESRRPSETTEE